jgi:murein L,D-transpeptidase YcbB/YkuD
VSGILTPVFASAALALSPLWFSGNHPTRQAIDLVTQMRNAEERGLRPSDYDIGNLIHSVPELASPASASAAARALDPADIPRVDALLSLAAGRFVSDLHSGRVDPQRLGYDLDIRRPKFNTGPVLTRLANADSVARLLDGLEPQFLHYKLLKAALDRYRQLATEPELNSLPDPGKSPIRAGGPYTGAPALRGLLTALGDLPAASGRADQDRDFHLDANAVSGLKAYQGRHGLARDGALGRETYRALTTAFTARVKQIELSLERWRWLPEKLEAPTIIVNIPEFRLFALYTSADVEQEMLKMDVIVGKSFPLLQTPVFAADMRYVVLHPYWDVPYSIVRGELLPAIRRDPTYIARNDYEIVRGQSDAAPALPVNAQTIEELARGDLRLRQKPGPLNPLGVIKFMLPNRHNVYLHGTSAPALFGGAQRAFSHGCIRLADPMGLLGYVLQDDSEWDQPRLLAQLRNPEPHRINLRKPIRVYILYTTALAAEDGRTLFFRDIYGHDARLQALLDARSRQLSARTF